MYSIAYKMIISSTFDFYIVAIFYLTNPNSMFWYEEEDKQPD